MFMVRRSSTPSGIPPGLANPTTVNLACGICLRTLRIALATMRSCHQTAMSAKRPIFLSMRWANLVNGEEYHSRSRRATKVMWGGFTRNSSGLNGAIRLNRSMSILLNSGWL